jgi:pimeloyl-ACP methyl ester carboxylesterase
MRRVALLAMASLLVVCGVVPAAGQMVPLNDAAKLFGARESHWAPELSPSGKQMLYLSSASGAETELDVQDFATGHVTKITSSSGKPEQLRWCDFATETQIICAFGGSATYENQVITFSRLVIIDLVARSLRQLGNKTTGADRYIRQYDGEIVDWNRQQPGAVLMARNYVPQEEVGDTAIANTAEGLGVDLINLNTLKSASVERPDPRASHYLSDGQGHVRIAAFDQVSAGGQLTGITEFRYRASGSDKWASLGKYDQHDARGFWPVAVDPAANIAYGLQQLSGRDALYTVKLDGTGTQALVAKNDKVDIDGVVRLDRGMPVIGYSYTDERKHIVYFDAAYSSLAKALSKALPSSPLIDFQSASADAQTLLVHVGSDTDAGAYYLLNRATNEMRPVLLSRDPLEGHELATVRAVSFTAKDGTAIPAYLTKMVDVPGRKLPAIILPHGGPSARDDWGFDWLAQFFAARGYAVIQPNFRGSAGYGADFEGQNAFRDWRTAMSDIDDSAEYLVKEGIADPTKMAIVGWSYGGYAALESAVQHPDRYKAVVAIAPVTDFNAFRRDADGFTNAKLVKNIVGAAADADESSPLQNASRIRAPVLLFHGDMDANVKFQHSSRMAQALQRNNVPTELVRLPKLDHQLEDSDARTAMLMNIGALLDRTFGH